MGKTCNIDQTDRINRAVIGVILVVASLAGASWLFFMLVGLIMIIQGFIGWCSLPYFISKFNPKDNPKS